MKNLNIFLSLLMISSLFTVGCSKYDSSEHDRKMAEIKKNHDERMAEIERMMQDSTDVSKILSKGGQPGDININGVAVQTIDKLDSRITVSQTAGLSLDGTTPEVSASVKLNLLNSESLESAKKIIQPVQKLKTYINLGCELASDEIAGLTESTVDLKTSKALVATRIFICGEQNLPKNITFSLMASDIMLKNAQITFQETYGQLSIKSDTLVLIGNNKITSRGEDQSSYILSASQIDLTVTTEIYGDGSLVLESIGGNYIKKSDAK